MNKINLFSCLLILNCLISKAQNYFPYCKEIPLELGKGFDISNPAEMKQSAFVSSEAKYDENSAETEITYKLIEDHEAFNKEFGAAASLNARILFKKLSANFQIDDKYLSSKNNKTLVFKAKSDFGNKGFIDYKLKPEAEKLITEGKFEDFIERYGTHFIQKTNTGVSLYVFLTFSESFVEQENSMEGSADGGGKILGGDASINKAIAKSNSSNQLHIEIYSNGPKDGLPSLSNIINSSENPIETIKEAVSEYLKKFTRESSKTLGYYYSSFSQFGVPKSKLEWNDVRENNLLKIKEEYMNSTEDLATLKEFESTCLFKKASPDKQAIYNSLFSEYMQYKDSLVRYHKRCLTINDRYYNENEFKASDIVERLEKAIEPMSKIVTLDLASTVLENGYSQYWNILESCASDNLLKIRFKTTLCSGESWQGLIIRGTLQFYLNDALVSEQNISSIGKSKLVFNEMFYAEGPSYHDLKFTITAKDFTLTDSDGVKYVPKISLDDSNLVITID